MTVGGALFFPGAGSGRDTPSLVAVDRALVDTLGVPVVRVDFPYRREGRRAPDRAPKLIACVREEAALLVTSAGISPDTVVLGGRSMGGRMCSMAVAEGLPAAGLARLPWLTPEVRVVAGISLALVMPLLCLTQLLIVNAAVVLFPAWSHTGTSQTQQGIEIMGQRILFLAGQIVAMALALLPAVLVAGVAFAVLLGIIGNTLALGLAALLGNAVLAVMVGLGVWWLGGRFEQLDLSQELRP